MSRRTVATLLAAALALVLAACSGTAAASPTRSPTARGSPQNPSGSSSSACVSKTEATRIWTRIDLALNAIELDPKHAGVSAVATGQAEQLIEQYLQQQLESSNLTEREVDKLESLIVVDPGCNGGELDVHVVVNLVEDDYLKPDGKVDHPDPQVGTNLSFDEVFVRVASGWKEANFSNLDTATQTPQLF